jgi:hypothetical protein
MDHTIDMREDILRNRVDDVAHNLLISRDPHIIGRVGNMYLLLVSILGINELGRRRIRNFKRPHHASPTESGHNLSFPREKIFTGELAGRGSTNRSTDCGRRFHRC